MKALLLSASLVALAAGSAVSPAPAATLDLVKLSCAQYENEVLPAAPNDPNADSIDTVMWLYGYSVAKSGQHVLSTAALAPFGFALDGECKANPKETLSDALALMKPQTKDVLDVAVTECGPFAARHKEFARSDSESAKTIMMWLFGFSEGGAGGHTFDAAALPAFESALLAQCDGHPSSKLVEAIAALRKPARKPRAPAAARGSSPVPSPAAAPPPASAAPGTAPATSAPSH